MFGFVRRAARKNPRGAPLTPTLGWDLHAHLLPGVDDGVRTVEDAIEAIRALQALGYRGSVLTPHVYHGLYPQRRAPREPAPRCARRSQKPASITSFTWLQSISPTST
jgi:hypothetical protein